MFFKLLNTPGYCIIFISMNNFHIINLFSKIHRRMFHLHSERLKIQFLQTLALVENWKIFPSNNFMDKLNVYVYLKEIIFPVRRVWGIFFPCLCFDQSRNDWSFLAGFYLIWGEILLGCFKTSCIFQNAVCYRGCFKARKEEYNAERQKHFPSLSVFHTLWVQIKTEFKWKLKWKFTV